MFRKNNDEFSDLEEYKRNRDNTSADNYFERDDYDFGEYKKNTKKEKEIKPNSSKNTSSKKEKKGSAFGKIAILIAIVSFGIKVIPFDKFGDSTYDTESELMYDISDFKALSPREDVKITSTEFVKLYNEAKQNRIKYDRLKKQYVSGDYKKNYVVNKRYLNSQDNVILEKEDESGEVIEYDIRYYCLQDKEDGYDYDSDTEIDGSLLSCGLQDKAEFANYPTDIINNESFEFSNYTDYNSESMDRYYINGVYYTKELADRIVMFANKK